MREFSETIQARERERETMLRSWSRSDTEHTFPLHSRRPAAAFTDEAEHRISRDLRRARDIYIYVNNFIFWNSFYLILIFIVTFSAFTLMFFCFVFFCN